jgi:hypothetical protein
VTIGPVIPGNGASDPPAVVSALATVTSLLAAVPVASAAQKRLPDDGSGAAESIGGGETITGSRAAGG